MPDNNDIKGDSLGKQVSSKPVRWAKAIGKRLIPLAIILIILNISGCMEKFFYHPTAEPTPPPRGVEGVWFESDDGTKLFGWWIPAKDRKESDAPAPTVLHVHGNAGNISSHDWFTEHLPKAGINVFIFDFRGYGQSEGRVWKRGPLIRDTHAALDTILKRPDVDPNRIGMYAQSLGGAIGLNVMAEREEIRVAVFESAFSSWRDIAANAVGGEKPGIISSMLAGLLISDSCRPDEAISRIDRPIIIYHGTTDGIVPFLHGERLKEAGNDKTQFLPLLGGEHNSLKESHPEIKDQMIQFFFTHLSP